MSLRLVIADDHPTFRAGLAALVAVERDIEVVGEAATGEDAISLCEATEPDVVVMDLSMPGMGGVEATRHVAGRGHAVLVLSMSDRDDLLLAALRNGARGYVLKTADPEEIISGIRTVAAGRSLLGTGVSDRLAGYLANAAADASPFPQLSRREHEVLEQLARGCDNATIGRRLFLSDKTVRNYVSNILAKIQVASRAEAVAKARDAGMGSTPRE